MSQYVCACACVCGYRWLKAGASYMQFNAVMKTVIEDLTNALKVGPTSFEHLAILLGV